MILYVPPTAPALVRDAAAAILALHIGGGALAVASGFTALATRKGGVVHRRAGDVFVIAMLVMGGIGAAASPFLPVPQPGNVMAGAFACYMVATGYLAVRRQQPGLGRLQIAAMSIPLIIAVSSPVIGVIAWRSPGHELAGVPFIAQFAFAALAGAMLAGDVRVLFAGGLSQGRRLARHLWRMSFGLLLATGSALGQPRVIDLIPAPIRTAPVVLAPIALIVGLMIFWLVRTRLQDRRPSRPRPTNIEATA
jgi:hypothetical protein